MIHLAPGPGIHARPSGSVKAVAVFLDVHESIVRRAEKAGELEGFTVGKRALRIFWDSVHAYQARRTRKPEHKRETSPSLKRHTPKAASIAAHKSAARFLEEHGCTRRRPWAHTNTKETGR